MNIRKALRDAQNGDCPLCCKPLGLRSASIDHVVPLSKGGNSRGNRFLVHKDCNARKADRMPTELELRKLARVNQQLAMMA